MKIVDTLIVEKHLLMISLILLQDKFNQLLSLLPDLREMAQRGEDFLYFKHMQGHAPHHTLLMEMLLAKRNDVVSFICTKFDEKSLIFDKAEHGAQSYFNIKKTMLPLDIANAKQD